MQLTVVNKEMWRVLEANHISSGTPVHEGVRRALGMGVGQSDGSEKVEPDFPVYAFLLADVVLEAENPSLVVFFATPGRLVRYEWTKTAALSTTVPFDRITQVDELESGDALTVTIQVDSHSRIVQTHSEARTSLMEVADGAEDAEASLTVTVGREQSEGLLWRLAKTGDDRLSLAEFSRRIRLLVGA